MLVPAFREALPEAIRWRGGGQRRRAHRLAEERGHRFGPRLVESPVELLQRRLAGRVEAPRRGRDVKVRRQVGGVRLLERAPAGQRERPHRGPVVRLRLRDHAPARAVAALDVVQPGELKRRLVRLRAPGDEAHPRHPGRDHLQHAIGQSFLGFAREVVVVEVRDALGLIGGCVDDLRHPVAEARDHRTARTGVQDPATVGRGEPDAVATFDARILEIEEPREDMGVVRGDPGRGHALSPPAGRRRWCETRRAARRHGGSVRRAAGPARGSRPRAASSPRGARPGSTPSASSSWR